MIKASSCSIAAEAVALGAVDAVGQNFPVAVHYHKLRNATIDLGVKAGHRGFCLIECVSIQWRELKESAPSLGLWDLVAVSEREVLLIQVKSNRYCPRAELEKFKSLPVAGCVRKLIHVWRDFAGGPEIVEVGGN